MPETLVNWLVEQLRDRGWSQNDLARESGLTSGAISNYINDRTPRADACKAIAKALDVPAETVLELAGYIPKKRGANPKRDQLLEIFEQLGTDDQDYLTQIALARVQQLKKKRELKPRESRAG